MIKSSNQQPCLESVQVPRIAPAPEEESRPRAGGIVFPPAVEARFRPAMAALFDEMHARDEVIALLFFGSVLRGEARPGSDLDLYALTNGDEQWSRASLIEGVDVQLQLGPLRSARGLVEKRVAGVVESFAIGVLLFDKTGEATALKRVAEERYRAGPPALSAFAGDMKRFALTNLVSDVEDVAPGTVDAHMLSGLLVVEALRTWYALQPLWRTKKLPVMLRTLRSSHPAIAEQVDGFYASPSPARAVAIADAVLATMGGRLHEFTTPVQRV